MALILGLPKGSLQDATFKLEPFGSLGVVGGAVQNPPGIRGDEKLLVVMDLGDGFRVMVHRWGIGGGGVVDGRCRMRGMPSVMYADLGRTLIGAGADDRAEQERQQVHEFRPRAPE